MVAISVAQLDSLRQAVLDLSGRGDREETLQLVAERAVDLIPGCEMAGISMHTSLRRPSEVETTASTSQVALEADHAQYELDEGPCLDALRAADTYVIENTATELRWPHWVPRAQALGIRSVLSVRFPVPQDLVGGINLYSRAVSAYDEPAVHLAHLYAAHAATVLELVREVQGLRTALRRRHSIGVAQGILMQRFDLDVDGSFSYLTRRSQHTNVKLRDVADEIVRHRQEL
ncbi:MAG: GAF and ANTAR domain-containing protein [Terracoccus sp.]